MSLSFLTSEHGHLRAPATFTPGGRVGTHCTRSWVSPIADSVNRVAGFKLDYVVRVVEGVHGAVSPFVHTYEGDSVNRSQMDIKRKTCDIRTWKRHSFLEITSTNIDILVPSLYQRVETRSTEVF
jgi:hypothetical protein